MLQIATVADEITPWGSAPAERDRQLRNFWPTEPFLASVLFSTVARYASFGWHLNGPARTVRQVRDMLHDVEDGKGWEHFISKVLLDTFTQDNAGWIELLRKSDDPLAPTISMNHLDSARMTRTGRHEDPVIYTDDNGSQHLLKWYQVFSLEEMPSPITTARGMQYSTLTRVLRAAQIMRDISIYKREKVSGRFTRAIHLVGGIGTKSINDALTQQRANADNRGLARYIEPLVIGTIDPQATVSSKTLEFASLPDGFDEEKVMRWYVIHLANAFGVDPQDIAPLPGGNLGSAQQSETLALKGRGKGPSLFMSLLKHHMNFRGIIPNTVSFDFGEQDIVASTENQKLRLLRAQTRAARIASLEITPEIARQEALDDGDLTEAYLLAMGEQNLTDDITIGSSKQATLTSRDL